jgi:hypothetical protein
VSGKKSPILFMVPLMISIGTDAPLRNSMTKKSMRPAPCAARGLGITAPSSVPMAAKAAVQSTNPATSSPSESGRCTG